MPKNLSLEINLNDEQINQLVTLVHQRMNQVSVIPKEQPTVKTDYFNVPSKGTLYRVYPRRSKAPSQQEYLEILRNSGKFPEKLSVNQVSLLTGLKSTTVKNYTYAGGIPFRFEPATPESKFKMYYDLEEVVHYVFNRRAKGSGRLKLYFPTDTKTIII